MVVVIDNGAYCIKILAPNFKTPRLINNCLSFFPSDDHYSYVGNKFIEFSDKNNLEFSYPSQRGFIINWEHQKDIFEEIFKNNEITSHLENDALIFTEPIANFDSNRKCLVELLIEDFNIKKFYITTSSILTANKYYSDTKLGLLDDIIVVDSGFSFTHIVPISKGKIVTNGLLRIDVGGKLLTNYMRELVSLLHVNITNEPLIANFIKEDTCRVSLDFFNEMDSYKNLNNTLTYNLPNFVKNQRGKFLYDLNEVPVEPDGQTLKLGHESIVVPEILFNPSLIGINQMGLSDALINTSNIFNKENGSFADLKVVLSGGNCRFPNFRDRIIMDIRDNAFYYNDHTIHSVENPITNACIAGRDMAKNLKDQDYLTKKFYDENGEDRICQEIYRKNYFSDPDFEIKFV